MNKEDIYHKVINCSTMCDEELFNKLINNYPLYIIREITQEERIKLKQSLAFGTFNETNLSKNT